ncbi:TorD/DmsD family molecular chaperone [Raoultibacter phocaeensis]|uniref:TorD/DmsD family molecular chaperone n=1 Tax=Raoultibacter phocaeensis TaxID=2479841 RepID=UPI0015D5D024|nr:molecular chaperone TorD family protein [Raoultibacter phocaeensis]
MGYCEERGLARAQGRLCCLLAACFRRPDDALAEKIIGSGFSEELGAILSDAEAGTVASLLARIAAFEQDCASSAPENVRLALELDYNRLFVGPAALLAPPYESYYASDRDGNGFGRLRTAEERAVVAAYRESGYEVPESFTDLPDHIAVELEFLALVAEKEASAWEAGDADEAEKMRNAQAIFLERHVGTWAVRFAEHVERGARTPLYPAVAQIVALFCGR